MLTPRCLCLAGWLASGVARLAPAAAARGFSATPAEAVVEEAASANELGAICPARACPPRACCFEPSLRKAHLLTAPASPTPDAVVPKLEDANLAGGPQASTCTLIVTEGDSAKALAVSGLSIVGRDRFGVFPLRGKVLNVRDATPAQLAGNDTIAALKAILGLRDGAY